MQALHLLLELLVTVLQLLDAAGELADRRLEAADAGDEVGVGHLRTRGARAKHAHKKDYEQQERAHHHKRHLGSVGGLNIVCPASKL